MDSLKISASSPRRRRDVDESLSEMKRSTSNNSSTSSGILVAGPSEKDPSQQPSILPTASRPSGAINSSQTTARNNQGCVEIRFGSRAAKETLRGILRSRPKPVLNVPIIAVPESEPAYEKYGEGPNHRGTYSKEYKLKHPEIEWIHRGQGRYLPATEVKADVYTSSPHSASLPTEQTPETSASGDELTQTMYATLAQDFDDYRRRHNPIARANWSPSFKHQFNSVVNLLEKTPRRNWPQAIELIQDVGHREVVRNWITAMDRTYPMSEPEPDTRTRLSRQAKAAVPSIEHRRSSRLVDAPTNTFYEDEDEDDEAEDSEGFDDSDRTYRENYVDEHPDEVFHHVGNGWYKRGAKPKAVKLSTRRDSSIARAVKRVVSEDSRDADVQEDITIHGDDVHLYVGEVFHHKGNRFYKRGYAPNGRKGTFQVAKDGTRISLDKQRKGSFDEGGIKARKKSTAELDALAPNATVSKEFKLQYPEVEWVHVGAGRYRRKDSNQSGLCLASLTPAASSERRSSRVSITNTRDYTDSQVSDEMTRTSGRRKRSSKSSVGDDMESFAEGAYDKPKSAPRSQNELFTTEHVKRNPQTTFHHRGQGKWALGLPDANSSAKMAIQYGTNDPDPGLELPPVLGEDINEAGELPPGLTELVLRAEGPDKWPNLRWVYRGGGKWCRQTKEEIEDSKRAAAPPMKRQRLSAGSRGRGDGPEAQLQREALAAEFRPPKGKAAANNLLQKPRMTGRKRSYNSHARDASKASSNSQSKAPTPKPTPLPPEQDALTKADLPSFYKDTWSDDDLDSNDLASQWMRKNLKPITGPDAIVAALTKYNPAVRSLDSLKALASNAQAALMQIQDEFLELDKVVARNPMNGKKERKPVRGGRDPVSHEIWEDKKEATLYDYSFDARKIGYQDPDSQKIVRDAEGRELRRRRHRFDPHATQVNYGDGEMTTRRNIKPVSRFDGVIIQPPRKKLRQSVADGDTADGTGNVTPSMTPERAGTPTALAGVILPDGTFQPPSRGRWKDHVPKRIRELRGESIGSARSTSEGGTPKPTGVRKGRPPGSKNLHKRKDAGIKKGPRKPKTSNDMASAEPENGYPSAQAEPSAEASGSSKTSRADGVAASQPAPSVTRPDPMSLDAIIGPQSAPNSP